MADHSAIEWTDATWNPTTGCTKISPGCAHCYIERTPAFRIAGRRFVDGHIPLQLHANRIDQPRHWQKPRRVFVNSLSDLFHEDVPQLTVDQVFNVMCDTPQHTYQILTKRPERMLAMVNAWHDHSGEGTLSNVWLGVSVENRRWKSRIDVLRQVPAAVLFLSCEPLLEDLGALDLTGIDWVIVGGESGPKSRDCAVEWVRSVRWQCHDARVPCFVKQLGRQPRINDGVYLNLHDKKGGDVDEWPHDLRVRQYPEAR